MSAPNNAPQPPGLITSSPHTLQNFDLTAPILRFDFPTPAAQATFHRAFLQVRNEKDKAAFMQRFFDNYDGQVSIPRRVIMDTSRDEEVARRLQESLPVEVDTGRDEQMARQLQGQMEQMGRGGFGGTDTNSDERASKILVRILDNPDMVTRLLDEILDYRLVAPRTRMMNLRAIMAMRSKAIQDMVKVTDGMATATTLAGITGVIKVEAVR
ncbi:hypothetical protein J4E83_001198 [Alternaria metachromatica]|uniref:uncharacterized protein n=1 Tax=Alternaria metachromatica TaxID=283354 RepID=UPI0020C414E4|nr:uncharacterized protein J4E83_001198 [Alternaria metachromatica]KAI4636244.1 hypothetical protein J4E83_001198 [Alternaria metachromatica]